MTELESNNTPTQRRPRPGWRPWPSLLGKILTQLAGRREVSLAGMVFIGDTLGAIGMTAEASRQYRKDHPSRKPIPQFAKVAEKAVTRVRAHLVGLLRKAAGTRRR